MLCNLLLGVQNRQVDPFPRTANVNNLVARKIEGSSITVQRPRWRRIIRTDILVEGSTKLKVKGVPAGDIPTTIDEDLDRVISFHSLNTGTSVAEKLINAKGLLRKLGTQELTVYTLLRLTGLNSTITTIFRSSPPFQHFLFRT